MTMKQLRTKAMAVRVPTNACTLCFTRGVVSTCTTASSTSIVELDPGTLLVGEVAAALLPAAVPTAVSVRVVVSKMASVARIADAHRCQLPGVLAVWMVTRMLVAPPVQNAQARLCLLLQTTHTIAQ